MIIAQQVTAAAPEGDSLISRVLGAAAKLPTMRRVPKDEVTRPTAPAVDGLAYCLDCWKTWMHRSDTDLGVKGMRSLQGDGDGYGDDTSYIRRDNEIAEATDAMISSLQRSHQWAIRRKCGITRGNVWRFPQLDAMAEAEAACTELAEKLKKNIATRLLF